MHIHKKRKTTDAKLRIIELTEKRVKDDDNSKNSNIFEIDLRCKNDCPFNSKVVKK